MGAHKKALLDQSRFRIPALLVIAVGLIVFGYFIARTFAAGSAQLSLSPASGTYTVGSSISVQVKVNTGTDPVNAVQADFSYPSSKLQFVSIDPTGSGFGIDASSSGGNGTVSLARGNVAAVYGTALVATVKFTVLTSGSAPLAFLNSSAIVRSTDNTNILGGTVGAAYTLSAVAGTPTPVPPTPTPVPVTHTPTPKPTVATKASPTPTPTPTPVPAGGTQATPTPSPTSSAEPSVSSTPAIAQSSHAPVASIPTTTTNPLAKLGSPSLVLGVAAVAVPLILLLVVGALVGRRHKLPEFDNLPTYDGGPSGEAKPLPPAPSMPPQTVMPSTQSDEPPAAPPAPPTDQPPAPPTSSE